MKKYTKKDNNNLLDVPKDSSLGHLAYGDLAFSAWRKLKNQQKNIINEK